MEFEEFSRQFRERTAQRMLDFEAALARAQNRMERAAQPQKPRGHQPPPAIIPQQTTVPRRRTRHRGTGSGQVRGILKRG